MQRAAWLLALVQTSLSGRGVARASAANDTEPYYFQDLGPDHIPGSHPLPPNRFLASTGGSGAARLDAHGRVLQAAEPAVNLYGLTLPISVHYDGAGNVFVAEKGGVVKKTNAWKGAVTQVLLDISAQVSSFGDHGLTSIYWHQGYLYVTYMAINPQYGNACADYGQMDGRPLGQVNGCKIYGKFSRWPCVGGVITGGEEVLIDSSIGNIGCVQFSTHSTPTCAVLGDDGAFYVAMGDGAAFTLVDVGQLGQNPCGDNPGYLGAYRCQDPKRINGKILRFDLQTMNYEIFTTGHRNPFRLTAYNGNIYESETGWYTYEEINLLQRGKNYGWPCYEGPNLAPEYLNFDVPCCKNLQDNNLHTPPHFAYGHPPKHAGNIASISAVAGLNGRLYFGDYTQGWIKTITENGQDEQTIQLDSYPVELRNTPMGMVYVDHLKGFVQSVATLGSALATPTPSPIPPFAVLSTQSAAGWKPGVGTVTFTSQSNVEGREGAQYNWQVTLLTQCVGDGTCSAAPLFRGTSGKVLTINTPTLPGTLEVRLDVRTFGGVGAATIEYAPSLGEEECHCEGVRTAIQLPSAPGSNSNIAAFSIDVTSPAFLGGVIAASALFAAGIIAAGLYAAGCGGSRGGGAAVASDATGHSRSSRSGLSFSWRHGPSMSNVSTVTAPVPVASAAANVPTAGAKQAGAGKAAGTLAARRPEHAGVAPLVTGTESATAPTYVSPATAQSGGAQPKGGSGSSSTVSGTASTSTAAAPAAATPVGDKKV